MTENINAIDFFVGVILANSRSIQFTLDE